MEDGSTNGKPGTRLFEGQLSVQELSSVRHQLTSWAREAGLDQDTQYAVTLSGYEALANTVEHAYREEGSGPVELHARRAGDVVTVVVHDQGQWRAPATEPNSRGRGLMLIRALGTNTDVQHSPTGTVIRMTWQLPLA